MIFTANNRANNFVGARFHGRCKVELLRPGLEEEVPSLDPCAILGSQKSESMNGTIAVPRLSLVRRNSQSELLARLHRDLRCFLSGDLVAAVAVGRNLDDALL